MASVRDGNRTTVVTGGSRGIGAAVCRRLAEDGHDVVIGYRSDAAAAETVAEEVRAAAAGVRPWRSTRPTPARSTGSSTRRRPNSVRSPGW